MEDTRGDWIDGKFTGVVRIDGNTAGLSHGYGVYRFYTRDYYSWEWIKGQTHGIGVQTCSDGSCYVGDS